MIGAEMEGVYLVDCVRGDAGEKNFLPLDLGD
jgi:hypothetical protein